MIRKKWNSGWHVSKPGDTPMMASVNGDGSTAKAITLPHDAMIHEKRTKTTKNQHQTGFYPGGVYHYTKTFDAPETWEEKNVTLEFEGVYRNAMVYVNGDYAGGHPYGYTNFYIELDDFLKYGQSNEIEVNETFGIRTLTMNNKHPPRRHINMLSRGTIVIFGSGYRK